MAVPTAATIPRWWVNLIVGTGDTSLVYTTSALDNTNSAWPLDVTYRIRISGGAALGSPVILAQGGYHDGLSGNFAYMPTYSATGFRELRLRNLASGTERILFTGPTNGKERGDTSQACNVSISPDFRTSPHILALDFGYEKISSVVGRPYGLHEILFRLDTNGNVVRWYAAPKGFIAWQDAEWSNHLKYAVAVGEDQSQEYPAVVGTNLDDSATVVLARGTNLRQPGLWIKPGVNPIVSDNPGMDSLGRYNEPANGNPQAEWAEKMKVFWINRDSIEIVGLGSSHLRSGMRPGAFTHFYAANLGYADGGVEGPGEMLRHYVFPHCPRLRAVIFEIQPGWLYLPGGDNGAWQSQMSLTSGFAYDRENNFWEKSVPVSMDSAIRAQTTTGFYAFDSRGGSDYPSWGWGADPPAVYPQNSYALPDTLVSRNVAVIESLANETASRGALFVMSVFPQSPLFRKTAYYGTYGPTWNEGRAPVAQLMGLCGSIPNCRFYDANREGDHDYDFSMFNDQDHLSSTGAKQLSHRLDSAIVQWTGKARS